MFTQIHQREHPSCTININKLLCKTFLFTSHLATVFTVFLITSIYQTARTTTFSFTTSREKSGDHIKLEKEETCEKMSSNCTLNNPVCFSEHLKAPQATPPPKGGREELSQSLIQWKNIQVPSAGLLPKLGGSCTFTTVQKQVHLHVKTHTGDQWKSNNIQYLFFFFLFFFFTHLNICK